MEKFLFDFDGTLVDSMPTYVGVMLRILDEYQISYSDDLVKIITPLGYVYTAKYYVEELRHPLSENALIELMHKYAVHEYTYNVQAKPSVIEVLKTLKARGADLNVLTASPHASLDPCLKRLGIWDLFTNVWSCEDFGTSKADPNIYHMAAERMHADVGEVLFLDDNYNANKTAKEAGMQVCGVYDNSSREYIEEIRSISDHYIYDFKELLAL